MRRSLRSYRFTSCSKAAASPFLLAWTRSISPFCSSATSNCVTFSAIGFNPLAIERRKLWSLHYNLAGHLRMDSAVVRICSRLSEGVGEFLIRIQHLGLEQTLCADRRLRNVVTVGPDNCCSDEYRERLRPENEIID